MTEEIIIACPECDTEFYVPREYSGGVVDCSECGTAFEIVAIPEDHIRKLDMERLEHDDTIVMSRNDIGMIPELEDVKIR